MILAGRCSYFTTTSSIIILLFCRHKSPHFFSTKTITTFIITKLVFFHHLILFFFLFCKTMSSMMSAQGVVFATAMAVSGTVILLALRLQKSFPPIQFAVHEIPPSPTPILRSCISSDGKKKKKKRVHFAEDVMDSCRDGEEFRRRYMSNKSLKSNSESKVEENYNGGKKNRGMPANRVALYNGILRDRVAQRLAYSC